MLAQAMHYCLMLQLQGGVFAAVGNITLIFLSLLSAVIMNRKQRFNLGLDVSCAIMEAFVDKPEWTTDHMHLTLSDGQVVKARWIEKTS